MNTQKQFVVEDYTQRRANYFYDGTTQKFIKGDRGLEASRNPLNDLELIKISGQDPRNRQYRSGYEDYFEQMPSMHSDSDIHHFTLRSRAVMVDLAHQIIEDGWLKEQTQASGEFARTIVGMESPLLIDDKYKEGSEILVAHWGRGFESPIHGHSPGYMHEEILEGKILVNTYRMIDAQSDTVRIVSSDVIENGTFVSQYAPSLNYRRKRSVLIHNFVAVKSSHSLHYVPEHTRDGRDNGFVPEYFEDLYHLNNADVTRLSTWEAFHSYPGTVILVRSNNTPEYRDHYIVITGSPVQKPHGIRPQDTAIVAPHTKSLLDQFEDFRGLILLKLNKDAQKAFLEFHDIKIEEGGKVIMPQPTSLPL